MSNKRVWLIFTLFTGACIVAGAILGAAVAAVLPSTYREPDSRKATK